jgi:hypothetical protein
VQKVTGNDDKAAKPTSIVTFLRNASKHCREIIHGSCFPIGTAEIPAVASRVTLRAAAMQWPERTLMLNKANIALYESMEQLCEPHPLLEQLGSMDGLFTLSKAAASLRRPPIKDLKSLVKFLEVYEARILLPLELPAIYWAHQHALRNETRELLKLDASIRELPALREFSSASRT